MQGYYPNRLLPKEGGHQAGLRALENQRALHSHLLTHPHVLSFATKAMEDWTCSLLIHSFIHSFTYSLIPTLPRAGGEWLPATLKNPRILCAAAGSRLTLGRPGSPLSFTWCYATWDIFKARTMTATCLHRWEPSPGIAPP